MLNTAFCLGRVLAQNKPDLLIHFGIAGAFNPNFKPGSVVEIKEEHFWKLGAEDKNDFLSLEDLGFSLMDSFEQPVYSSLMNPAPSNFDVPRVKGITSNTVHGNEKSIREIILSQNPDVETMESAAFFQACLLEKVPFWAFRGISNFVEPRNRDGWKLQEAAKNVQEFVKGVLAKI